MTPQHKILMVQPLMGMAGTFVRHTPLGLLHASARLVTMPGLEVDILDLRIDAAHWHKHLKEALTRDVLIVGISVMSGRPIKNAMEIGALVKEMAPWALVVWGGSFPTFHPDFILRDDPNCDYVVSGYGVEAMSRLTEAVLQGEKPEGIPGVHYRSNGELVQTPADWCRHEMLDYREIPYGLISDYSVYGQLDHTKRIFSIYSAMGCVYRCAFCSSPALYRKMKSNRWSCFDTQDVADHIQYLVDDLKADYIYFIDDDSFIKLGHVEAIIDEIQRRGIKVQLGFRGARINEIKKMDHAFIDKLAAAGTDILHVGAESGSDRMLKLVRKDCTVADILECNRKLAQHHEILIFYNFIMGLPTETLEDLRLTGKLMLQLCKENPRCIIGPPNRYRPLPGTELFELAVSEWGYLEPSSLKEFIEVEVEGDFQAPWFSKKFRKKCDLLLIAAYFIDDKINKVTSGGTLFYRLLRLLSRLYAPIIRFRLKHFFTGFFIERHAYKLFSWLLSGGVLGGRTKATGQRSSTGEAEGPAARQH